MHNKTKKHKRVLITNGSSRTSYAAMRSLSKIGLTCFSADVSRFGMCQYSRFSKGNFLYTSHYNDEELFISELVNLIETHKIDILFPSHNETEIIARHRHRFSDSVVSVIPNESHCKIFNNKSLSYDFVEELGILVPTRISYESPEDIISILESKDITKTVIKLLTGNSGKGVFYGTSPKNTYEVVKNLIDNYDLKIDRYPQVEEYVEGDGFGNSVLYWNGEHIADFTHKRLRDKIESGGTSILREASHHEGIEEAAKKIFDSIGWHGLAMSEFKVCPKTGDFWFIEVNPRMWGSIPLAIAAGVDFPYLTYICSSKNKRAAKIYSKDHLVKRGWKGRWLLGDIFVCLKYALNGNFKKVMNILFHEKADSLDDFFWDDPLIIIGEIFAYLKKTISKKSLNPSEEGMIG